MEPELRRLVEDCRRLTDENDALRREVRWVAEVSRESAVSSAAILADAKAETGRLRAERDAVIALCVHASDTEPNPYWAFVGDFGPVPYQSLVSAPTRKDAVATVRRAAGLDPEG